MLQAITWRPTFFAALLWLLLWAYCAVFCISNGKRETDDAQHIEIDGNGIVLIPGLAGTGLLGSTFNTSLPDCNAGVPISSSKTRLWISVTQALPPLSHQRCWAQKLKLLFGQQPREVCEQNAPIQAPSIFSSSSTNRANLSEPCFSYQSHPGVVVEVDAPGSTAGIDYLDYIAGFGVPGLEYMHALIQSFVANGYISGDTLLGHPYDWRMPYWQLDYAGLKRTIEKFVLRHPTKKVVLVSHSFGATSTNLFLTRYVSTEWKNKHIEAFVSIAGPYAGSFKTIRCLLSGYQDTVTENILGIVNVSIVPAILARGLYRSFGGVYSLLPNLEFYNRSTPVVTVNPEMTFYQSNLADSASPLHSLECRTAHQGRFLEPSSISRSQFYPGSNMDSDIKRNGHFCSLPVGKVYTLDTWWTLLPEPYHNQVRQVLNMKDIFLGILEDPQVPVYCFWSTYDTPTTEVSFTYTDQALNVPPLRTMTFGDNTVPRESASYCAGWASTTFAHEFRNLDHEFMIQEPKFVRMLTSLISGRSVL